MVEKETFMRFAPRIVRPKPILHDVRSSFESAAHKLAGPADKFAAAAGKLTDPAHKFAGVPGKLVGAAEKVAAAAGELAAAAGKLAANDPFERIPPGAPAAAIALQKRFLQAAKNAGMSAQDYWSQMQAQAVQEANKRASVISTAESIAQMLIKVPQFQKQYETNVVVPFVTRKISAKAALQALELLVCPPQALAKYIPGGWTMSIAVSGEAGVCLGFGGAMGLSMDTNANVGQYSAWAVKMPVAGGDIGFGLEFAPGPCVQKNLINGGTYGFEIGGGTGGSVTIGVSLELDKTVILPPPKGQGPPLPKFDSFSVTIGAGDDASACMYLEWGSVQQVVNLATQA
jgi:hypothetical protein